MPRSPRGRCQHYCGVMSMLILERRMLRMRLSPTQVQHAEASCNCCQLGNLVQLALKSHLEFPKGVKWRSCLRVPPWFRLRISILSVSASDCSRTLLRLFGADPGGV
jgi:hypothetical protein